MKTITQRAVAADLMQRDIVTVSPDDTLREALALMTDSHVTGLPVMDGNSQCVGLITASDILNYEAAVHGGKKQDLAPRIAGKRAASIT